MLKSHTEFNHHFTSNHHSTASMGSSTTQRAHATHGHSSSHQMPGSKSTTKANGQNGVKNLGMKNFIQDSGDNRAFYQRKISNNLSENKYQSNQRSKKLVSINDGVTNVQALGGGGSFSKETSGKMHMRSGADLNLEQSERINTTLEPSTSLMTNQEAAQIATRSAAISLKKRQ